MVSCNPRSIWPSVFKPWNQRAVHQPRRQHFIDVLGHLQGADEGNHDLHILQTHLSTDHLHSLMLWSTNFWGVDLGLAMESDGTWWNCILGVGTWDCPQELDGKTWENMEKQQTLQESSRPFRRFEETISFRISQAFKYHPWPSNKTWPFLKLKLEQSLPQRGGTRTKSKITAETVAPFRSFQYLSVVAQVKRNFMKYFRCCLSPEVNYIVGRITCHQVIGLIHFARKLWQKPVRNQRSLLRLRSKWLGQLPCWIN